MLTRSCVVFLSLTLLTQSPACASSRRIAQQESRCIVSRVVDGDTFRCSDGRRVRLIGIDSPESPQGPYGTKAAGALRVMLPSGTPVRLEHDVTPTDRYGRLLVYAWIGPTLVNEAMVQDGWAVLYTRPPNVKYAERLWRAQNEARTRSAGLWSENGFACLPSDFRRRACVSPP
jgi:micrococcal nuclease